MENNQLPPEQLEQEEQKQEQKEQKKEENKKTLKTVISSIVCTLLFIIILLLLILLGLKKCASTNNGGLALSEAPSGPKYNYDNVKLDDKFKKIVQTHLDGPGGIPDTVSEVKIVTYTNNYDDGYFTLNITALSESNNLYLYNAIKVYYPDDKSSFDNLISYLLLDDTPDNIFTLGKASISEYNCYSFIPTSEVINTDKQCKYIISNSNSGLVKYFDGFYYENNQYNIYHHQEYIIDTNPFISQPDMVVNLEHPLYSYYQELSKGDN